MELMLLVVCFMVAALIALGQASCHNHSAAHQETLYAPPSKASLAAGNDRPSADVAVIRD